MAAKKEVVVKQIRSTIGRPSEQLRTLESLGLGRIGRKMIHRLDPSLAGMLRKVRHLVHIEENKPGKP